MRERLFALGAIAAVLVIAVVVGFVFFFGRLDPSPPSLRDTPQPSIPGEILFVDMEGCLHTMPASGAEPPRELVCRRDIQGATWLGDGRVLYATIPKETQWWVFDPATGQQSRVESNVEWWTSGLELGDVESPTGELVAAPYNSDGDIIVVANDGTERVIYEYDGPNGYYPEFRTWSPDGKFIAVFYGRKEEIWLIAADGSVAGTLAKDVRWGPVSWRIEGVGYLPALRQPIGGLD